MRTAEVRLPADATGEVMLTTWDPIAFDEYERAAIAAGGRVEDVRDRRFGRWLAAEWLDPETRLRWTVALPVIEWASTA